MVSAAEQARRKLARAGFEKLRDRKYIAPVAGVSEDATLEIPGVPYGILDLDEGYHVERARVANAENETMGLYSGVIADTQPTKDIEWGVYIPPYKELVEDFREREGQPSVVLTFADDRDLTMQSMGYELQGKGGGVTAWRDVLD